MLEFPNTDITQYFIVLDYLSRSRGLMDMAMIFGILDERSDQERRRTSGDQSTREYCNSRGVASDLECAGSTNKLSTADEMGFFGLFLFVF